MPGYHSMFYGCYQYVAIENVTLHTKVSAVYRINGLLLCSLRLIAIKGICWAVMKSNKSGKQYTHCDNVRSMTLN